MPFGAKLDQALRTLDTKPFYSQSIDALTEKQQGLLAAVQQGGVPQIDLRRDRSIQGVQPHSPDSNMPARIDAAAAHHRVAGKGDRARERYGVKTVAGMQSAALGEGMAMRLSVTVMSCPP